MKAYFALSCIYVSIDILVYFPSVDANPASRLYCARTHKHIHAHQVNILEKNLGWYLTKGLISMETAQEVNAKAADLCRDIAPQALSLCDAFALTDTMISAPIARDWVEFNVGDNFGEVPN